MSCLVRDGGLSKAGLVSLNCSALDRLGWLSSCSLRFQRPLGSSGLSKTPSSGATLDFKHVDKNTSC
jgi:hypothetical protein